MLAYAADRRPKGRTNSPSTLLLILAGHAVVIGAVMTARMDVGAISRFDPTKVVWVPESLPPPPDPVPQPKTQPSETHSVIDLVPPIVPTIPSAEPLDTGPRVTDVTPVAGTADPLPIKEVELPAPAAIKKAARFATAAEDVRPPYPEAKRRLEQEASLRLAIAIDARGRVVSVEPVGAADPVFLEAARRHILKRWRYQPATEDGVAVASRTVVTLKFELDE